MAAAKIFLSAVRIEGFRSCQRTFFRPHERLSVLIGRNGAGKTNILQALRLLKAGVTTHRYRREDVATSRLRIFADFCLGRTAIALRSTISYLLDEDNSEDVVEVVDEWRLGSLDNSRAPKQKWIPIPPELILQKEFMGIVPSALRTSPAVLRHYYARSAFVAQASIPLRLRKIAAQALSFRSRISYYSAAQFTNPTACPPSFEVDAEREMSRTGIQRRKEHTRFLYDLYRLNITNSSKYESYLTLVGKQGLGLLSRIYFREVKLASRDIEIRSGGRIVKRKRERILIVPSVQSGTDRLSFSQLSEGTFKTLALIFYLITDDNNLLLIEEPEVCVHHGLLLSIVELIKSQSTDKQIIVSTHSDVVLDQLDPDNVFSVTMRNRGGTAVSSLARGYSKKKIALLREYLRSSGNLGEYWRQGGFDR